MQQMLAEQRTLTEQGTREADEDAQAAVGSVGGSSASASGKAVPEDVEPIQLVPAVQAYVKDLAGGAEGAAVVHLGAAEEATKAKYAELVQKAASFGSPYPNDLIEPGQALPASAAGTSPTRLHAAQGNHRAVATRNEAARTTSTADRRHKERGSEMIRQSK